MNSSLNGLNRRPFVGVLCEHMSVIFEKIASFTIIVLGVPFKKFLPDRLLESEKQLLSINLVEQVLLISKSPPLDLFRQCTSACSCVASCPSPK